MTPVHVHTEELGFRVIKYQQYCLALTYWPLDAFQLTHGCGHLPVSIWSGVGARPGWLVDCLSSSAGHTEQDEFGLLKLPNVLLVRCKGTLIDKHIAFLLHACLNT